MLSYNTPATIDANNREADRIMRGMGRAGVPHNGTSEAGKRSEALAKAHADALARRRAG